MKRRQRDSIANRLVFLMAVALGCWYGGAKNGAANKPPVGQLGAVLRDSRTCGTEEQTPVMSDGFCFSSFGKSSNMLSFAFAFNTNFHPFHARLELYEKLNSLTNGWNPLLVRPVPPGATDMAVDAVQTNADASASFYAARVDTLKIDFPGLESAATADGKCVYTSFGETVFPVSVVRSERSDAFPPLDAEFAANPFAHVAGLAYDPTNSTVSVDGYGVFGLPDGNTLIALGTPIATFGSPHVYSGVTLNYDASTGLYSSESPYPLSSPSLQREWARGSTPGTGCSCVPSIDFGNGLVMSDAPHPPLRAASPTGLRTTYDYGEGGVWITTYWGTNVVWKEWCPHKYHPEFGGTSDDLDGQKREDECGCGDGEGSSSGSVRLRIPLGSPRKGAVSGYLYFNREEPFAVTLDSFLLLKRADARVSDVTDGSGRTVTCRDNGGRTLVLSRVPDGVEVEVRDTSSQELLHTWEALNEGDAVRLVRRTVLGNVLSDKSYACSSGIWTETDNVSDVAVSKIVHMELNRDGLKREETVVSVGGLVCSDIVVDSERIGSGNAAVLRETVRREKGANESWKVSHATYWDDPAHRRRHGSVRLEWGDDRSWFYQAYDDEGRRVFRLEQKDGSSAPPDALDYSLTNLPPATVATVTVSDFTPLEGDDCRSNDWDRVRTESRYVVDDGVPVLIGRTWRTFRHGNAAGYPTLIVTTERAASQNADFGDPNNAVTVETLFDDMSADVPYVLRGERYSFVDEGGFEARDEPSVAQGVLRTVGRKFGDGVEAKTRRIVERDIVYGNVLYEASALSADGTEFDGRRHAYDGKNRHRFTAYDDGSWETNAFSCCRLLWSVDRTGAKTVRHAVTGADHLYHADLETSVSELPRDAQFYDSSWSGGAVFKKGFPAHEVFSDGLGRITNDVWRIAYFRDADGSLAFPADRGRTVRVTTTYPQGFPDVSERVDGRGLRTVACVCSTAASETAVSCEYAPGEDSPSVTLTNVTVRGGGSLSVRVTADRRVSTSRSLSWLPDGMRREVEVETSSDRGCVTNLITTFDFLGRIASTERPLEARSYAYDGSSSRIVATHDALSGVSVTNLYDEVGDMKGQSASGVSVERVADYEFRSNAWWKVERTTRWAGARTNSETVVRTRLSGLSGGLRSERIECLNGVETRHSVVACDVSDGSVVETVRDATTGDSWSKSRFGHPVESFSREGRIENFYGPYGRVFVRKRTAADGSGMRYLDGTGVDGFGNVVERLVADRFALDEVPTCCLAYDCRGNRSAETNEIGEVVLRSYDTERNLIAETGDAYPTTFGYDSAGNRISLGTSRNGSDWDVTQWTYGRATGLCEAKAYSDGSSVGRTHAPDGLQLRVTQPDGSWTEDVYDSGRRLVGVVSSDASCSAQFENDEFGRRVMAACPIATYGYELSLEGVVTNETAIVGSRTVAIERRIDRYGRLTGETVDGRSALSLGYSPQGLLSSASNADCTVVYRYDAIAGNLGYVLTLTNGMSFVRSLTRHDFLRDEVLIVTNVCGEATDVYVYAYDALHRPIRRNDDTFAYNRRGEVTNEVVSGFAAAHAYDFIGNERMANGLNQYLGLGYSSNGELIADGTFGYRYDACSRLVSVTDATGALVISNRYDHLGRRVVKVAEDGTHVYFYDGHRIVLECVSRPDGGEDRLEYFWGKDISETPDGAAGVGGLLYVKVNGAVYVPFYDAYGNVMGYRDANGVLVASYAYDAFGKTIAQSGRLAGLFRHRYATKCFDVETGLYDYGLRFYSPEFRRWLTRDPIGEMDAKNLYLFCMNRPIALYDILGLACRLGSYNVLSLVIDAKPAMNGTSYNPFFIDNGEALMSSIGQLDFISAPASLMTGTALTRLLSVLDMAAGKGFTPNNNAMEQIRRLLDQLKRGSLEIYGRIDYEMCVCKNGENQMVLQTPIKDGDEIVLDPLDSAAVRLAYDNIMRSLMRKLSKAVKNAKAGK